jgi:exonuclease 3'-5' domain-containing protein 1
MSYSIIKDSNDISNFEKKLLTNNFREYSVDLEGERLCRHGRILNIQLYIIETNEIFIFECLKLSIPEMKRVLDPIFDNASIVKHMFDCRSDVDALYHQYNIKLSGVVDIQLYEIAYRKCNGMGTSRYYNGLFKTLTEYASSIDISEKDLQIKKKYSDRFCQKNYELNLNDIDVLRYLSIDVLYLKKLYVIFNQKIGYGKMRNKIESETELRQNCWQKGEFVNDRSNAISAI